MITLQDYGWNEDRLADWNNHQFEDFLPARVIADYGNKYKIALPDVIAASLSRSAAYKLKASDMPKVGDWVAVKINNDGAALVQTILPRVSEITRGCAGEVTEMQVMAANIDLAFIVQPLDSNLSVARLERFLFQLAAQNIEAVILLNKADRAKDLVEKQAQIDNLGVRNVTISALLDEDMGLIEQFIWPGKTVVVLGQSGAGKSTILNRLLGKKIQATQAVRKCDLRGRHTTVHRELFVLPNGGLVIDTPGIRELKLWGEEVDLDLIFPEIASAVSKCHYNNCTHDTETRCGVKAALADGSITSKRYAIYLNFKQELQALKEKSRFIANRRSERLHELTKRRRKRIVQADIDKDFDI